MKISDHLMTGKENAISMADLAHVLQVPERILRMEILQARINGELICSCVNGYFLPESDDDIREYVYTKKALIKSHSKALKPFIKALG